MTVTQSARNRLRGTVVSVQIEGLVAQVVLEVGGQRVVSLITAEAARDLNLVPGDAARAVVKATSVMVERDRD